MNLKEFVDLKGTTFKTPEKVEEEIVTEMVKEIEELKASIKSEQYLWDMRCWDKYKDEKEVLEWIDSDEDKNCGHVKYCMNKLLESGVSKEEIKDLIMSNPFIQYKKRIVRCWNDPTSCPKLVKAGNYSDCKCEDCK